MRNTYGVNRRGSASAGLAVTVLLLAAPLTAAGADRMVLGEYFTATW